MADSVLTILRGAAIGLVIGLIIVAWDRIIRGD